MTNFEMYKDDLLKIEGSFAVDKNSKKIAGCDTTDGVKSCINCSDCIFDAGDCFESDKIEWLYKEYEPPVLSNDELELIKAMEKVTNKKYKYIVRNNPRITLFTNKPFIHHNAFGYFYTSNNCFADISCKDGALFQNIKNNSGIYDIENNIFIQGE